MLFSVIFCYFFFLISSLISEILIQLTKFLKIRFFIIFGKRGRIKNFLRYFGFVILVSLFGPATVFNCGPMSAESVDYES